MSFDVMKQALDALQTNNEAWKHLADSGDAGFWEVEEQPFYETSVKAITALRAAIKEAEKPRQWQGLTDEERTELRRLGLVGVEIVEAKLKEKNA